MHGSTQTAKLFRTTKSGKVTQIIPPIAAVAPEQVHIELAGEGPEPFFRQLRFESTFEDEDGIKSRLTLGANITLTVEAGHKAPRPADTSPLRTDTTVLDSTRCQSPDINNAKLPNTASKSETLRVTKSGVVSKIIPAIADHLLEQVQIEIDGAEPLFREIRIENALDDGRGKTIKLAIGARVTVTIEADQSTRRKVQSGRS